MWSEVVVVLSPIIELFLGIFQGKKPIGVEALVPVRAIEAFNERVVSREINFANDIVTNLEMVF